MVHGSCTAVVTGDSRSTNGFLINPKVHLKPAVVIQAVVRQGPNAIAEMKDAVFQTMAPHTLHIVATGIAMANHKQETEAASSSSVETTTNQPAEDSSTKPPPARTLNPPPVRRSIPGPEHRRGNVVPPTATDSPDVVEAWAEATVPERRKDKTVNVAEALTHAKVRDSTGGGGVGRLR
jgi:hypothetical protein